MNLQNIISTLTEYRRRRAIERAQEKRILENRHRRLELFLDDLAFQTGLSWEREQDRLAIALAWAAEQGYDLAAELGIEHEGIPDEDPMPRGGLDF